ncbi:conserved hypothetical protein [uncultured Desulfobacterium sp.]|uniref:Uncharacterized protein n=1 Tax=uncultured Desulfobacterium sp. TaxID=201089 RepID=A0A445MY17_9BACT|nr:conserved hypothetical protein [uncultured Desulfobacterium sp.]
MGIIILKYRPFRKNTLIAFVDLGLEPSGLEIRECSLHEKNGKRWLGFPARPYQKDGKTTYASIVQISDKGKWATFQKAAVAALDAYLRDHPRVQGGQPDGDCPF